MGFRKDGLPDGTSALYLVSGNLVNAGDCRQQYIDALRAADRLDYSQLLAFVRS